jgi:isocitrate lyase
MILQKEVYLSGWLVFNLVRMDTVMKDEDDSDKNEITQAVRTIQVHQCCS